MSEVVIISTDFDLIFFHKLLLSQGDYLSERLELFNARDQSVPMLF